MPEASKWLWLHFYSLQNELKTLNKLQISLNAFPNNSSTHYASASVLKYSYVSTDSPQLVLDWNHETLLFVLGNTDANVSDM